MKSSYHGKCKLCGASHNWASNWLPVSILEAFANIWIAFHAFIHHSKELTKGHVKHLLGWFFCSIVIIIMFTLFTILRIVLYPLWWVLKKLF